MPPKNPWDELNGKPVCVLMAMPDDIIQYIQILNGKWAFNKRDDMVSP
jgi:hypothetical protein